jgi:hypothetical protein
MDEKFVETMRIASRLSALNKIWNYPEIRLFREIPRKDTDKDWNYYLYSIETPVFFISNKEWQKFKALLKEYASFSYQSSCWAYLGKGIGRGFKRANVYSFWSQSLSYHIDCVFIEDIVFICAPMPIKINRAYTHWGSYKGTFINHRIEELEDYNQTVEFLWNLYNNARSENISAVSLKDMLIIDLKILIGMLKKLLEE